MATLNRLERYLRVELEKQRPIAPYDGTFDAPPMFVTISRQAGAGGHSLATALLEVFSEQEDSKVFGGWQIFDQSLCDIVASDPLYTKSLDSLVAEEYRSPTGEFFHQLVRSTVDQDMVMARVFQVVRSVALMGRSIIIGRAGSHVTSDLPLGVRLRVVAPEETRVKRLCKLDDLTESEARGQARRLDENRRRLLKAHFQMDIDDPMGYDAIWNTGSTSIGVIAEATTAALHRRLVEFQTNA